MALTAIGGVVIDADADATGVRADIVDAIGNGLAELLVDEVVHIDESAGPRLGLRNELAPVAFQHGQVSWVIEERDEIVPQHRDGGDGDERMTSGDGATAIWTDGSPLAGQSQRTSRRGRLTIHNRGRPREATKIIPVGLNDLGYWNHSRTHALI